MAEKSLEMNTILGENSHYEGNMNVKGSLRIEGEFVGEISADSLVIGKKAKVEANIKSPSVMVGGYVKGNISENKHLRGRSRTPGLGHSGRCEHRQAVCGRRRRPSR